ncbi:MAG: hypothetical protein DBX59_02535 [Bacillota bacterium]|nr:MAG: hypothetical protein DBX59_02535 [Bacillota bacterium]
MFGKLKRFIVGAAFDAHWTCAVCGREIFGEGYFCRECEKQLPAIGENFCAHCGRELETPAPVCETCKNRLTEVDGGRSAFRYEGSARALVKKFKYGGAKWLAEVFALSLREIYDKSGFSADAAVSVPMLKKDIKKRGYNQTDELLRAFSALTGVPAAYPLEKRRLTKRQATLAGKDRLKNLIGAFKITDKAAIEGKTVMIIDDVTTTGATLQAVATALKNGGAKRVYALTIASVSRKGEDKNPKNQGVANGTD